MPRPLQTLTIEALNNTINEALYPPESLPATIEPADELEIESIRGEE